MFFVLASAFSPLYARISWHRCFTFEQQILLIQNSEIKESYFDKMMKCLMVFFNSPQEAVQEVGSWPLFHQPYVSFLPFLFRKARFISRTLHEPNLIPIKIDPNN